jgi:hypothetical protein
VTTQSKANKVISANNNLKYVSNELTGLLLPEVGLTPKQVLAIHDATIKLKQVRLIVAEVMSEVL